MIHEPTHLLGNILDLVITNNINIISVHPKSDYILQSDHFIITFALSFPIHYHLKSLPQTIFIFDKTDWNNMNNFFATSSCDRYFYSSEL